MHNSFPLPALPLPTPTLPAIDPEVVASTPPNGLTSNRDGAKDNDELPDADQHEPPPNSQSSSKENDIPTDVVQRSTPPAAAQYNHVQQSTQMPRADGLPLNPIPPEALSSYDKSRQILEKDFAASPPYTIQRLASLVLEPHLHYRFLPAYLRALDRIVSVSSPVTDFPLPTLHTARNTSFLSNGDTSMTNGHADKDGLGSDESLGGALLTPIPWLRNNTLANAAATASQGDGEIHSESTQTIDGPRGSGSIETVTVTVNGIASASSAAHTSLTSPTLSDQSDASSSSPSTTEAQLREQGAVTQGELLRQEQEAGVIPLTQMPPHRTLIASGALAVGREDPRARPSLSESIEEGRDDLPHARGPEEIGMEDMGPQHDHLAVGLDLEAAVGRGRSRSPQPPPAAVPDYEPALEAEAEADKAEEDDAGEPGQDPLDVEKDVERLKEAMDAESEDIAKFDEDGDVMVTDADGRDVDDKEKMEITGDLSGADAVDTTTL